MGVKQLLIAEFDYDNFWLENECRARFVQAEFGAPRLYLVWRLVWMLYQVAAVIASGFLEQFYANKPENRIKWFIFLTNWAFVILAVATILEFCSCVYVHMKHPEWLDERHKVVTLPWYLKAAWSLANVTNALAISISASYWASGVFNPREGLSGHRILPFLGHGMNSIYVVCNFCVTAMPVRLFHCWQPFLFTVIYGVFNVIYIGVGLTDDVDHHYIYPPMDWRSNPIKAEVLAIGMLFSVVIAHTVFFFLHILRRKLYSFCSGHVTDDKGDNLYPLSYGSTEVQ